MIAIPERDDGARRMAALCRAVSSATTRSRIPRSRLSRTDGTTSIEFAVIALFFFALSLGAVEVGRAMWVRNSVQFAAEEAARWAVVRPTATTTQIEAELNRRLTAIGQGAATVGVAFQTSGARSYVVVTATTPFQSVTGLVPVGPITLLGRARMPIS